MFINGLIEGWSTVSNNNPWVAPEQRSLRLSGRIYGHLYNENRHRSDDGTKITTSRIVSSEKTPKGIVINTASGSRYLLGEPDPAFVNYCKDNGYHIPTKDNPIKFV